MASNDTLVNLLQQLAFAQAGGKPQGMRDVDKLQQAFQTLGQGGQNLMTMSREALQNKQLQRSQTPYSQIANIPTADQVNQDSAAYQRNLDAFNAAKAAAGLTVGPTQGPANQDQAVQGPLNQGQSIIPQPPLDSTIPANPLQTPPPVQPTSGVDRAIAMKNLGFNPDTTTLDQAKELAMMNMYRMKANNQAWINPAALASGKITPADISFTEIPGWLKNTQSEATNKIAASGAMQRRQDQTQLSPSEVEFYGQQFRQTGQLPSLGMGAAATRIQIMKAAAQQAQDAGQTGEAMGLNQAVFKAGANELANVQKNRGQILAFENTAQKNLDIAQGLSDKVDRTGVPILNRWILAGKKSVMGDPDVSSFDAAVRTAINEYARVTTTVTGGGVTSDQARKEVEDLLNTAQTPQQFNSVVQTLRQEMENRRSGYESQIGQIKNEIGNYGNPGGANPNPPAGNKDRLGLGL